MKPHKHAELIKAWADGAEIQVKNNGEWINWDIPSSPYWNEHEEYRIKPEPKLDTWALYFVEFGKAPFLKLNRVDANLRLVWDGETGELKSAEVLK